MIATLIVAVRGRLPYAQRTLPLLAKLKADGLPLEIVVVESGLEPLYGALCSAIRCTHIFEESKDGFHKTRLLNKGLAVARGEMVVPYDVDLFPINNSLERHLWAAGSAKDALLVAGYRLLFDFDPWPPSDPPPADISIGSENRPSALWKALNRKERFGVAPVFMRDRLEAIGGWDNSFIGWGAEDQDVIERYLNNELLMVLAPDAVYGHLAHDHESDWKNDDVVSKNRGHYYAKRQPKSVAT